MLEFQYFEGCPNASETLDNIRHLIANELIKEELMITEIKDISESEALNFQGSPTVLFNGIDIYTGKIPTSNSYTCRVYVFGGKQTGVLETDYILNKIEELKSKQ